MGTGCPADKRSGPCEIFVRACTGGKTVACTAVLPRQADGAADPAGRERGRLAGVNKPWNQSAAAGLMRRRRRRRHAYRRSGASRGCTGGSIARQAEFRAMSPPESA